MCCGTFDGDAGGDGGLPLPVATPGHPHLVGDVVARLTEEVDAALLGETPARRRLAAEAAMFGYQRVSAVAQSACTKQRRRKKQNAAMKTMKVNDGNYSSLSLASTSYGCLQFNA